MNADASPAKQKTAPANQHRRFARKTGFGERRSDAKPVSMKIFLLPKFATQSPRNPLSAVAAESQ
jgi:hypothetical protein